MSFRYKLRPLAQHDTPESILEDIFPTGNGSGNVLTEGSPKVPWGATVAHLRRIGATCLLIQTEVRDPDFLEEHRAFYSKQHRAVDSRCVRLHAFDIEVPAEISEGGTTQQILDYLDHADAVSAYLGFVTLRPLRHAPVGATILKPEAARQPAAIDSFPVHIAGTNFEVRGTPFLQQDNAVGACAQASIWMALRTLRRRVGNSAYSPAELTIAATRYLAADRTFPGRQGLTTNQMLEAVRSAGHDPLHLMLRVNANTSATAFAVLAKASPYIDSGLPVIAILLPPNGGHAVLAIGQKFQDVRIQSTQRVHTYKQTQIAYSMTSDWVRDLLVHNDNSGPYLDLKPAEEAGDNYCLEHAYSLIVPLPEGVYTSADEAEVMAVRAILFASVWFTLPSGAVELPRIKYVLRPYLCARHAFRSWAKSDPDLDLEAKSFYRTATLPRTLWVIEIHSEELYCPTNFSQKSRCGEIVLDPAADALHGDALIFVRVTHSLWPGVSSFQGLLISETASSVQSIALKSGNLSAGQHHVWS